MGIQLPIMSPRKAQAKVHELAREYQIKSQETDGKAPVFQEYIAALYAAYRLALGGVPEQIIEAEIKLCVNLEDTLKQHRQASQSIDEFKERAMRLQTSSAFRFPAGAAIIMREEMAQADLALGVNQPQMQPQQPVVENNPQPRSMPAFGFTPGTFQEKATNLTDANIETKVLGENYLGLDNEQDTTTEQDISRDEPAIEMPDLNENSLAVDVPDELKPTNKEIPKPTELGEDYLTSTTQDDAVIKTTPLVPPAATTPLPETKVVLGDDYIIQPDEAILAANAPVEQVPAEPVAAPETKMVLGDDYIIQPDSEMADVSHQEDLSMNKDLANSNPVVEIDNGQIALDLTPQDQEIDNEQEVAPANPNQLSIDFQAQEDAAELEQLQLYMEDEVNVSIDSKDVPAIEDEFGQLQMLSEDEIAVEIETDDPDISI